MTASEGTRRFAANAILIVSQYTANALDNFEDEDKPGRVIHIAPGSQVAADDCCLGQLWARVVNIKASADQGQCDPATMFAQVELGIFRCAATVDDDNMAPAPEVLADEGFRGISDASALLQAILCDSNTVKTQPITHTPTGPQGGCVGGYWTFTVRLDNCVSCDG